MNSSKNILSGKGGIETHFHILIELIMNDLGGGLHICRPLTGKQMFKIVHKHLFNQIRIITNMTCIVLNSSNIIPSSALINLHMEELSVSVPILQS